MAHARSIIRKAFVDALKGKTAAGNKVYDSRLYNMDNTSLPGIIVFSSSENVVTSTISPPRSQERQLKVTVECYAKTGTQVNSVIDDLAAEVEEQIAASKLLPTICKDCRLESTDIQLNSDGDQPVAVASLVFALLYCSREDRPDRII
jgi:hypothetical protein